jgi:hypothetical protein
VATLTPLNLDDVATYIHENIGPQFHAKKTAKIKALSLDDVIKRKNPYLFRAKGSNSAHDFILSVLDATVSSGEETTFGNFLENVAIFVCEKVYGGRKSGVLGIDLEFEDGDKKYLVSIKSGPSWGNHGQIKNLVNNFNTAKKTLATSGGSKGLHIICVEACCYGVDNNFNKGTHLKLCGQRFWELISGNDTELYRRIIEPLGHMAKERNDEIDLLRDEKLNVFTAAFVDRFCDGGVINWDRLIRFNSGKPEEPGQDPLL